MVIYLERMEIPSTIILKNFHWTHKKLYCSGSAVCKILCYRQKKLLEEGGVESKNSFFYLVYQNCYKPSRDL